MITRLVDVKCKFGHLIFARYRKDKRGFLMKCYIDRIGVDKVGAKDVPSGTNVFCPDCKRSGRETRVGRIGLVRGKPAVIINHGGVRRLKT